MLVKQFYENLKEQIGRDAEMLFCHIMNVDRSYLFAHSQDEMDAEKAEILSALAKELGSGKPIQYVLHSADFMGNDFYVDENVLIPRPETEELVALAIEEIEGNPFNMGTFAGDILDICTGSGCIACSLAKHFEDANVTASDISPNALSVAIFNARRIAPAPEDKENLGTRVEFVLSDLFSDISGDFDLITANPPYIPTKTVEELDPLVKDNEPHLALDGGEDGFDLCEKIIKEAPGHLKAGGLLLMEIGDDQGSRCLKSAEGIYSAAKVIKDLEGQDRIFYGKY